MSCFFLFFSFTLTRVCLQHLWEKKILQFKNDIHNNTRSEMCLYSCLLSEIKRSYRIKFPITWEQKYSTESLAMGKLARANLHYRKSYMDALNLSLIMRFL